MARMPHRTHRAAAGTLGATGLAAIALIAPGLAPADPPAADGVRDGRNLTIVHNLDFVAAFGYGLGDPLTVDVYRGPHRVATVTAPAVATPRGPGLEVNHGLEGAPRPGDCWPVYTPDIQPGDRIVVSDAGGQDAAHVDTIRITRTLAIDPVTQDVFMEGIARRQDGTPIPATPGALDSGEVRNGSGFRAAPTKVERIEGTEDGWRATFERTAGYGVDPDENGGLDTSPGGLDGRRDLLVAGRPAIGYGRVAPPPPLTQLVDGAVDITGPALGCPVSGRLANANAIIVTDDPAVNATSGSLQISGTAEADVDAVRVTVNDGDGDTPPLVVNTTALYTGSGDKSWSVTLEGARLDTLADGLLTLAGDFDGVPGAGQAIAKDVLVPAPPTATPAPGTYFERQSVTLHAEQGAGVRHTLDGSEPTLASARSRGAISVLSSTTIKALVVDAAGNQSAVRSFAYTITDRPPAPAPARVGSVTPAPAAVDGDGDPPAARTTPAPPRLGLLTISPRMAQSRARREGLRVVMRLTPETAFLRLRVYRRLRTGARRLVWSESRVPSAGRLYRVRLSAPRLRRLLVAGRYDLEVTPGRGRTDLGGVTSRHAFEVLAPR